MTDVPLLGLAIWGAVYVGVIVFYEPILRWSDRAMHALVDRALQ